MSEFDLQTGDHVGTVVALDQSMAVIRFTRGKMCSSCGACLAIGDKEVEMRVRNTLSASIGDRVEVTIASKKVVEASFLAYVVPLICLLVGIWVGGWISEPASIIGGILGCGGAYLALRLTEKKRRSSAKFEPHMTAICQADTDSE